MPTNIVARMANKIRKKYPHLRFRIRRQKLAREFATSVLVYETGQFIITIDKDIQAPLAAFLLAHEAAHCASWHMETEEHGPAFWSAYQAIYKLYEDFTA